MIPSKKNEHDFLTERAQKGPPAHKGPGAPAGHFTYAPLLPLLGLARAVGFWRYARPSALGVLSAARLLSNVVSDRHSADHVNITTDH